MCIGGLNQHSGNFELSYVRAHQWHCGFTSKVRFPMHYFAGLLTAAGIPIVSATEQVIVCRAAEYQVWKALQ